MRTENCKDVTIPDNKTKVIKYFAYEYFIKLILKLCFPE